MAIDFPVPTQLGEQYTDPTTGITYTCAQVGPPTVWTCGHNPPSADDTYVTVATTQDITGVKTFTADPTEFMGTVRTPAVTIYPTGGIEPTLATITETAFNLHAGISWTCGAITIPNPINSVPGQTGTILLTAAPTAWGASFKFPAGAANTQPATDSYPAIVPYFVQAADSVLLGTPISY